LTTSDAVAICVATYQRPDQLRALLDALEGQIDAGPYRVYLVDNDPDGTAEFVAASTSLDLEYIREPTPGIVAARNAALERCFEPLVAFIDDDEYPAPTWLATLRKCMADMEADVVWGPVVSVFPPETPDWVHAGNFFSRARYTTGTRFDQAATNNVLARRSSIDALSLPRFDERFSASGGSDSQLFHRIHNAGGKIVWCDEAIVYEDVPLSRMTLAWLRQRARRTGNVRGRLLVEDGKRARAWVEGLARVAVGGIRLVSDRVRRVRANSSSLNTWMRGWGILDAARGHVVIEYRRPQEDQS
jgi:succinoglycan biosynthesis protein ExoM